MKKLGSTILRFQSVASTNDVARDLAATGAQEGTCVLARAQSAGRGRHGRSWSSPPDEGLYMSLILRPEIKPANSAILTLAAAIAVQETLELDFHVPADIKWPNDLLVAGHKICGILVESAIEKDRLQYVVMGIGVNIAQEKFPGDINTTATSLLLETGRRASPEDFMRSLLERLDSWYGEATMRPDNVISRWQELSSYARDCQVRVDLPEGPIEGTTRGLTHGGALVVELAGGERREIVSGEISLRAATGSH